MDNRQSRTLKRLRSVLEFLKQHPIDPEPPLLRRMRTRLETSMERIAALNATQYVAGRAPRNHASQVRQMRVRLRRGRMLPLARIARPLLRFAPGSEAVLRVPHARADSLTLAMHAQAMARVLKPHAKLFVSAGYPRDVITALRADAEALATAAREGEQARKRLSDATTQLRREFARAADTLQVVEGILMPHFLADPLLEKVWRSTRRVHRKVGRPKQRRSRAVTPDTLATSAG